MNDEIAESRVWQPIGETERYVALDALRGLALLGVLLVNLHSNFRVSLADHILNFHTDRDWLNRTVDVAVTAVFEFKAFTLFSLLFGVGLAVFAERSAARGASSIRCLARRLLVLLSLGLVHLLLIWNGDILTLYAVCGFLVLPLLRLPPAALATAGVAAIGLHHVVPWGPTMPDDEILQGLATEAAQVYTVGSFGDVFAYHWRETQLFILPLVVAVLPRTWGLMAIGAGAWKAGIVQNPNEHRQMLWGVVLVGGGVGGVATGLLMYTTSIGPLNFCPPVLLEAGSSMPLALAYAAGLLLAWRSTSVRRRLRLFASVGQMALTNYLTQSIVLSLLFYGYGLGLFGRLGSAAAIGLGLSIYVGQLAFSLAWLRRYRFGPMEWLWRSLTYGTRQPMRRE